MPRVHLRELDLNLLVALEALLETRSVTRAAARLRLTQPAVSRALGRLRDALGDPLLVRVGRGMVPTPRAEALAGPLRAAVRALEDALSEPEFEPVTARRTFTLATADFGYAVVLPPLLAALAREAPGVTLDVRPIPDRLGPALEDGEIDLVIAPRRDAAPGAVWSPLLEERNVCLVRRDHPGVGDRLTLARYCALPHVFVSPEGRPTSVVDEALRRRGLERRVALRVPSFLVVPYLLARTDLVATLPARLAALSAEPFGLRVLPAPVDLPAFSLPLGWHERMRRDPGHAWLRAVVTRAAAAPLTSAARPPSSSPRGRA